MLQLLHYIIDGILEDPSQVKIEEQADEQGITFIINAPEEYRGLIIGKKGMNIKSIRNIIAIIARRENKQVNIKIAD